MEWVKLKGNIEVFLDDKKRGICRRCGAEIDWAVTKRNKWMPIVKDKDGNWVSHFVDCPQAIQFRKGK